MTQLNEAAIEKFAIDLFQQVGYTAVTGAALAPNAQLAARTTFEETFLHQNIQNALQKLNPTLPAPLLQQALKQISQHHAPDLLSNNETFHRYLTEGVPVTYYQDGQERGERVWLLDFDKPTNNEFWVVDQFKISAKGQTKRPDLILFINGFPLVVIELKNAIAETATLKTAWQQIETYKQTIPNLFTSNVMAVISDGLEARAGSLSAGYSRFMAWKAKNSGGQTQLETLIRNLLNPTTLLDILRHFIVFEKGQSEDPKTGQITIQPIKKMAAYHQYYAVNTAVASTLRAVGPTASHTLREEPTSYGLPDVVNQPPGDKKAGVVWHTQGSGKSLSMVFYTSKIVLALNNPTVLVMTDRNDLDDQLFETFAASKQLLRQEPVQANDRQHLKSLLKVASGGVIFSTIQKFQPDEGNVYEQLSPRANIIVIVDEAHRSQYGFSARMVDEKDDSGLVIGQKMVYGFAKYLRDALPNATYLGFTGTPIEKTDVNTPAVFGNYVDVYDIAQAVEDGATVRIFYESRLAKVSLSEEGKQLVRNLDEELAQADLTEAQKSKSKWVRLEALIGNPQRLQHIAADIVSHFEARQEVFTGKGMIVCLSRRIAVDLYKEIINLRQHWHDDDLNKGGIKVVMTAASSDGPEMASHHTNKEQRKRLAERMKDDADTLQLVIVRDMWLTGFDVPSMHTLYIDKPMRGHNLMQAVARVNRVYKDKPGGLVVDYLGIAADLKQALSFYADAGGRGDPLIVQEQAVALLTEKLEVVRAMYHGLAYSGFFAAHTGEKLKLILAAAEHILSLPDGRKRYINEVTALSHAFALSVPHEVALAAKEQLGFFQAVKARLVKFETTDLSFSDEALETTIRQVIDEALVSEPVVDLFDAAGIRKPDISILSDEFLAELKGYKHPNLAIELLKKLLNDELKARAKTNLVQSQSLREMLEKAIQRYNNKALTAVEVIEELIRISKAIVAADAEAEQLQLTEYEYAFYTAVAQNESARQLMGQETLRNLAIVLTQRVRQNATLDWTQKESVRAKLRIIIKRILRQYGYPPDVEKIAIDTVMKQAESIADIYTELL